jgi:hypothetical protein
MLNTFERKILRRIYGPTHEGGCWRSRWNNELYSLYKEMNIVEDINVRRLEWAVHIIKMEEERIPKKVLNGNFLVFPLVLRYGSFRLEPFLESFLLPSLLYEPPILVF